jgi:hypothetical protein
VILFAGKLQRIGTLVTRFARPPGITVAEPLADSPGGSSACWSRACCSPRGAGISSHVCRRPALLVNLDRWDYRGQG